MVPLAVLATVAQTNVLCTCRASAAIVDAFDPLTTVQCTDPNNADYTQCSSTATDFCTKSTLAPCAAIASYNTFSNNFFQTATESNWLILDASVTITIANGANIIT